MSSGPGVVLAIDVGSSALKAGLVADDGTVVDAVSEALPRLADELDVEALWRALAAVVGELVTRRPRALRAVALTAITRTQVFVDASMNALRPALTWRDARAGLEADQLGLRIPEHHGARAVTAFHPLARIEWIRRHEPDVFARCAYVLELKDFLVARLTGVPVIDTVVAARLAPGGAAALADLLADCGLPVTILGALREPVSVAGEVSGALAPPFDALAGLPVATSSMDTWVASVGMGAQRAGSRYLACGTSEAGGFTSDLPVGRPGLLTLPWGDGVWHAGGPTQAGADTLDWCARAFGFADARDVIDTADLRDFTGKPVFLPHLRGERVPFWNPDMRGVLAGVDTSTSPSAVAAAVLEGIAFGSMPLVVLDEHPATAVRMGGGLAASSRWCQLRADVLGAVVETTAHPETGLTGSAAVAWTLAARYPTLGAAQQAMVQVSRRFVPEPRAASVHARRHGRFRALQSSLFGSAP